MAPELEQALRANAGGPKRAKGDAGEVEQHPLPDQIKADRYLRSRQAVEGKGLGVRIKKLVPPGAA